MTKKTRGRPKKTDSVELSRWTILVPWETRSSATKAAERSGKAINVWLDTALLEASRGELTKKREVAKPEDVMDVIKALSDKMDKITEEVNKPWWKKIGV
jgi:hypothetical protein